MIDLLVVSGARLARSAEERPAVVSKIRIHYRNISYNVILRFLLLWLWRRYDTCRLIQYLPQALLEPLRFGLVAVFLLCRSCVECADEAVDRRRPRIGNRLPLILRHLLRPAATIPRNYNVSNRIWHYVRNLYSVDWRKL